MDDHAAGRKGQLHVLASTSAMAQFLPDDLANFARANPEVRLIVEEQWSMQIISRLLAGEADVGIVMEGSPTEGLQTFHYRTDQLAVVLPGGHPLAASEAVDFSDVLDYDLIALESESQMMRLLAAHAADIQKGLRLRVQVRGFEVVCRTVQAGLGIGLLPFEAASKFGDGMGLTVRPLRDKWATRQMLTCVKKDRAPSIAVTRLLETLRAPG